MIIADEPTTALDVIVQDRILKELKAIQQESNLAVIYISHDIAVVAEVTDRVGVMYAGRLVELGRHCGGARLSPASLHGGPDCVAAQHPRRQAPAGCAGRRTAQPGRPASGLPFSPPLRVGDNHLHNRVPTGNHQGRRSLGGLLAPAGRAGGQREDIAMNREAVRAEPAGAPPVGKEDRPAPLLTVQGLRKWFPISRSRFRRSASFIHAVDDVAFQLFRGESLGLVGESGSGKTTVGKLLVKLLEPDSGRVAFNFAGGTGGSIDGETVDIQTLKGRELRRFRRRAQMIFQDPYESMNPRRTIYDIVAEPLTVQKTGTVMDRVDRVSEMLALVGLAPPSELLFRHPHELSGGQRQRVAIARALVIRPEFVVADEPTSMLDVSSRAGIMLLLQQLAEDLGISYLYVTHDLAVARYLCDRIAVMYLGKVVELAETEELLRNPVHPYTKALLSAVPDPDRSRRREPPDIRGDLSLPVDPPPRCRFLRPLPHSHGFLPGQPPPALGGEDPRSPRGLPSKLADGIGRTGRPFRAGQRRGSYTGQPPLQ